MTIARIAAAWLAQIRRGHIFLQEEKQHSSAVCGRVDERAAECSERVWGGACRGVRPQVCCRREILKSTLPLHRRASYNRHLTFTLCFIELLTGRVLS